MSDSIRTPPSSAIDRENPWPGLASFTEDARAFFFGREKETDELVRLVRRNTLTVLFGQSGLGKSSLLQAGAFPLLREADYLPLYLRLDHDPAAPALADQIKSLLVDAFKSVGADAPAPRADESLWEYFHRKDIDIWSAKNRLLTPILAFDQFEEIFTLGRATDAQRERGRAFLAELADLVENRPPAALRAKFDAGELDPARYAFDKPSCQVILSLREDFLPDLEGLKNEMRSIMQSRMRVRRLNGTQALEIVTRPAPHLLADGVAERIVEFVAGARGGSAERLAELEVEPALLSVICRELNERRRTLGQPQISADLVSGNRREILTDFYERSVADLPEAMRTFVEDHLLTKSGFRDNLALETALEFPGVTRPLIDTLVARRLVRLEDRLGVQRVELTHDVLAEVIRAARDARQQRQANIEAAQRVRRQRWVIAGLGTAVCALVVGAVFGIRAQRRAERAQREQAIQSARTDFIYGARLLEERKTPEGLAYLVRAARSDPSNSAIATRLISALGSGNFAEPVGRSFVHQGPVRWAGYSRDNRDVLSRTSDGTVQFWDKSSGRLRQTIKVGERSRLFSFDTSPDGRRLAAASGDGAVQVYDLETGQTVLASMKHEQRVQVIQYSPDGRWIVSSSADQIVKIWDAVTGELKSTITTPLDTFGWFGISPDGTRLATGGTTYRIWRLPEGAPLTEAMRLGTRAGGGTFPHFSPDGKVLAINGGTVVHLCDGTTGTPMGEPMPHGGGQSLSSRFSRSGNMLVSYSTDGVARLWTVPTGQPFGRPLEHGADIRGAIFADDDRYLVTASGDGTARIWDVATGRLALEPLRTGDIRAIDVSPDGRELLTSSEDGFVRRWRFALGALAPVEIVPTPSPLALQRDVKGAPTAWAVYPDHLQKLDLLTGEKIGAPKRLPTTVTSALVSPNEKYLAVRTEERAIELWRDEGAGFSRRPLGDFAGQGLQSRFSRNSEFLSLFNPTVGVLVWRVATGERIGGPLPGLNAQFQRAPDPFSASADFLAVRSPAENTLSILDLRSGKLGGPMQHPGPIWGVAFSPDERLVASASGGMSAVHLWDRVTGKEARDPLPHRTVTRGATFTNDGRQILTWSRMSTHLWDVATGRQVTSFVGGNDIDPAIFSPDQRRVAALASATGEVRVFDRETGSLLIEPITGAAMIQLQSISFTADGRYLIAAKPGNPLALRVWPVPPPTQGPAPVWLTRLAAALAGGEIDERGLLAERAFDVSIFDEIRAELAALPDDAPYAEWGRWFLADRATRPIGPGLKITAAEAEKLRAGAGR